MDHHHPPLQFHIPQFVYSSAPTLVPGGGAEVVPFSNPEWFINNGFTLSPENHFFAQPPPPPASNEQVGTHSAPFDFVEADDEPLQQQQQQLAFPMSAPVPPLPPTSTQPDLNLLSSLSLVPPPFGLPVYSVSGFDIVSILSRVHHRPNATVHLGPVDLTCSFVVVDPRRYDHPIVYCSPTFCTLTGYSEAEVVGRNCRFLQAPGGVVAKGEERRHTSGEAVERLRSAVKSGKDVQTSIVNYKKSGAAFINLVTVITVHGEGKEEGGRELPPLWHVGFQVDLTEQPNAILEKLRDGTYNAQQYELPPPTLTARGGGGETAANPGGNGAGNALVSGGRDRRGNLAKPVVMSKELGRLLGDPSFLRAFPLAHEAFSAAASTATTASSSSTIAALAAAGAGTGTGSSSTTSEDASSLPSSSSASASASAAQNHLLHLFLLEASPDFIHVVSLKGSFLYVAPSVRRVLGYDATEMVGKSLADYAHPEDVVPLMRELKESSATGIGAGVGVGGGSGSANTNANGNGNGNGNSITSSNAADPATAGMPRAVDLLFRAKTKMGRYVWVECRGRLHVEPGKGRKAIILTGRAREMMELRWADVDAAGGLARGTGSVTGSIAGDAANAAAQAKTQTQTQGSEEEAEEEREPEKRREVHQEVWGTLGGSSRETATFLTAGAGVGDVLGWSAEEVVGHAVADFVVAAGRGPPHPSAGAGAEGAGEGAELEGMEGIGEVVCGMRAFQRERRARMDAKAKAKAKGKGKSGGKGDPARWRKMRCLMRTRNGGCVDVWFVIYRADVEEEEDGQEDGQAKGGADDDDDDDDDDGESDGDDHRLQRNGSSSSNKNHSNSRRRTRRRRRNEPGCSIAPAALVYQIRLADAETVRCGPGTGAPPSEAALVGASSSSAASASGSASGLSMSLPSLLTSSFTKTTPATFLSSLAASAAGSALSSSSSAAASSARASAGAAGAVAAVAAAQAHAKPTPSHAQGRDMFEALAIARGTSWQYELQQLRFANARLEEEVAMLEEAAAEKERERRGREERESGMEKERGMKKEKEKGKERKREERYEGSVAKEPGRAQGQSQGGMEYVAYGEPAYADAFQQQQQQPPQQPQQPQLYSRGQLAVQSHQDPYVHAGSHSAGLYDALGGAASASGREASYLHQPRPQYLLAMGPGASGRTALPLPSRERERQQLHPPSSSVGSLQYPPHLPPLLNQHLPVQQQQSHHQLHAQERYQHVPLLHQGYGRGGASAHSQPQPQTWGTMAMPPQPPSLIFSRHPSHHHHTYEREQRQDVDVDVNMDLGMDMDMDVEAMYAAAAAAASSGMVPAPSTSTSNALGASLKRSWSAVGS